MPSILLTPPAIEPVSLGEMKAFLRVEHDDDDDVIASMIAGARIYVEAQTRRALITQSWRLVLDRWPASGRIDVRPAPLRALVAARVYDSDGNAKPLNLATFVPDTAGSALLVSPLTMAQPDRGAAGIELDVSVGYGDAASNVPEPLRLAIMQLATHWYENRGAVSAGATSAPLMPLSVPTLLATYRMIAL